MIKTLKVIEVMAMQTTDVRQKIERSLSRLSPQNLVMVADFIEFLAQRQDAEQVSSEVKSEKNGLSGLLELAGTWEGDDLRDCLQLVYETRAPLEE